MYPSLGIILISPDRKDKKLANPDFPGNSSFSTIKNRGLANTYISAKNFVPFDNI